jgi:transposase
MSNKHYTSFWEEMQEKYSIEEIQYTPAYYAESGFVVNFKIESKAKRTECPLCGGSPNIHGYENKRIKFGTVNGVPAEFDLQHIRYMCKKCDITFMEEFENLPDYQHMSQEAENYIVSMLGSLTFTEIANQVGVSVQTVSNRAKAFASSEREVQLNGRYRYLSMDEVFISRKDGKAQYYWFLNDNSCSWKSNNIRIDAGRNKDAVVKRLLELKHPESVEAVSIDMWKPYLEAVTEALPQAAVVVDPFHLIQLAQKAMDKIRKKASVTAELKADMKKDAKLFLTSLFKLSNDELVRLDSYLRASPDLEKAYFIVQQLSAFYQMRDFDIALDYLVQWEADVINSGINELRALLRTVHNWIPYIMNFFIYRITNGKTEGKNNLVRAINRMGFHYGVNSIQACIYSHDRKQEYINWQRHIENKDKIISSAA